MLEAEFTDTSNGNGSGGSGHLSNGKSALSQVRDSEPLLNGAALAAKAVKEELQNGSEVGDLENGAVWGSRDPCEVGQLEACAQERYAGVASGTQADDAGNGSRCAILFWTLSACLPCNPLQCILGCTSLRHA